MREQFEVLGMDTFEMMAAQLRRYRDAGLQYLVLDPTQHSAPGAALEAIEFFADEVRPLLG